MNKACILLIILLALSSVKAQYLVDGERLDSIQIGKSTVYDVIANYGADYQLKKHSDYSNALVYEKLGLVFYSCQADPDQEIFAIIMQSPFNVQTSKGIVLGKSTFKDVYERYGRWEKTSAGFEYEEVGFYFDTYSEVFDGFESDNRNFAQAKKQTIQTTSSAQTSTGSIDNNSVILSNPIVLTNNNYNVSNSISNQNNQSDNNTVNVNIEIKNNSNSSNSNNKSTEDKELKSEMKSWGNKIVKKIELIEKGRLRQCYTDFRDKN